MDVLSSIKLVEVPQLVKALAPEEQDVLMKYLYAGMAAPEQNNSGVLLAWHEKVNEEFCPVDQRSGYKWNSEAQYEYDRRSTSFFHIRDPWHEATGGWRGKKIIIKRPWMDQRLRKKKYDKTAMLKFLSLWNLTRLLSLFFCCCCWNNNSWQKLLARAALSASSLTGELLFRERMGCSMICEQNWKNQNCQSYFLTSDRIKNMQRSTTSWRLCLNWLEGVRGWEQGLVANRFHRDLRMARGVPEQINKSTLEISQLFFVHSKHSTHTLKKGAKKREIPCQWHNWSSPDHSTEGNRCAYGTAVHVSRYLLSGLYVIVYVFVCGDIAFACISSPK